MPWSGHDPDRCRGLRARSRGRIQSHAARSRLSFCHCFCRLAWATVLMRSGIAVTVHSQSIPRHALGEPTGWLDGLQIRC